MPTKKLPRCPRDRSELRIKKDTLRGIVFEVCLRCSFENAIGVIE